MEEDEDAEGAGEGQAGGAGTELTSAGLGSGTGAGVGVGIAGIESAGIAYSDLRSVWLGSRMGSVASTHESVQLCPSRHRNSVSFDAGTPGAYPALRGPQTAAT